MEIAGYTSLNGGPSKDMHMSYPLEPGSGTHLFENEPCRCDYIKRGSPWIIQVGPNTNDVFIKVRQMAGV